MKDRFEFILFSFFSKIFCVLGIKQARKAAALLAFLFFYIIPIRKKVVIENLTHAFPEKSNDEIKTLAFNCYKSFSITLIEILTFPIFSEQDILKQLQFIDLDLVKSLYEKDKGLILLTAHFGNWELAAIALGIKLGIPLHIIVKSQRNTLVDNWMNSFRTKWTNKVIPLGISIRQTYKELINKNILALVADQRGPEEGIRVDFFNRPSATYTGPAVLALKTGAPIVMGIVVRQPDYTYRLKFEEISSDDLPGGQEEMVKGITQRHTSLLENYVRMNPEQWFWMHKRWKY
ncbi:MAG TPA: lysophospholipid acyltransferase family protein [Ignavibacteriaceae bacterium]|nr:lysophospholipid acyltransferase family protein [Ignavibacteriaceae bacterium]